jgi:hypothetical protein
MIDNNQNTKTYTPPVGGFTPEQAAEYAAVFSLTEVEISKVVQRPK